MIGRGDGGGRRSKHANWRNADPAPRRTNLIVGDDLRFSSREPNRAASEPPRKRKSEEKGKRAEQDMETAKNIPYTQQREIIMDIR